MEQLLASNFIFTSVGISVSLIAILGGIIFANNKKSSTAQTFLALSIITIIYAVSNFLSLRPHSDQEPELALFLMRFTIAMAILHSYFIFRLFYIFPKEHFVSPWWHTKILLPIVGGVTLINLSPLAFERIIKYDANGVVETIQNGPLFPLFGVTAVSLIVASFVVGIVKTKKATGLERKQLRDLLLGASVTYSLLIIFNFLLPNIFGNSSFVPFVPIFVTPFILCTAYAIYRHQLLNIKILATETFVLIISWLYFGKLLSGPISAESFVDVIIFLATVIFGIQLIRSVKQEVATREKVQELAKRLTETNWELAKKNEELRVMDQRKSEFVSIVSHQLRTPITAIKGYSSMLLENAYGPLSIQQHAQIEKIFLSSKRLADMVDDFLDISKIEQETMRYEFSLVDIRKMLTEIFEEFMPIADKKGITLDLTLCDERIVVDADEGKLRQIFSNLIDNAIKYTPQGSIMISLDDDREHERVVCNIKDTGIGLSQDDIHQLFTKFARGTQGQRENTEGSGLGLYVAKRLLQAMGGDIWVDSDGPGKGCLFTVAIFYGEKRGGLATTPSSVSTS